MKKVAVLILAAGQGTRMKSALPKVLHPLAGKPMIWYSLQAAKAVSTQKPVVVVGHGADQVRQLVGEEAFFAVQEEQLGTGHAVQAAEKVLTEENAADLVLVISADMPLLREETLKMMVENQRQHDGPLTMVTVERQNPRGFGRIVRAADGSVAAIVEEAQATPEQLAINELNVGAYCFEAAYLWQALKRVPLSPKGEYYLTDVVGIAVEDGLKVSALKIDDVDETIGVNNRVHLAECEVVMRRRINEALMMQGVSMIDPQSTYIECGVQVGRDTVILPNTILRGDVEIGEGCEIGPNALIENSKIGNRVRVISSMLESAVMEDGSEIGPFGHLRKGAHLGEGVHMGNFGEIKNSYLGPGVKMGHFSYLGDAQVGAGVNIGAGTITCNFDGSKKHPTVIGAGAFIGSDTMLVSPVNIGEGASTGAGAVVTHDVPPHTVVVGVPARPYDSKEKK